MVHLAALLSLVGLAHAVPADEDYTIGAGDTVDVVIHGHDFGVQGQRVSTNGAISVPYVGRVEIAGLTTFEAEKHLRERLSDGYLVHPQVTVRVTDFTSRRVELFGAVKAPGVYHLEKSTNLRGLIAQAQGVLMEKATGFISVTRDGKTHQVRISELEGEGGNYMLQSGDIVDVREGSTIFLAGEVNTPGAVAFNRGLTASQALLMAGGTTEYGRLSGAYILRGSERIQINLKRVLKGKDADIELQPGDRIVVPNSPI